MCSWGPVDITSVWFRWWRWARWFCYTGTRAPSQYIDGLTRYSLPLELELPSSFRVLVTSMWKYYNFCCIRKTITNNKTCLSQYIFQYLGADAVVFIIGNNIIPRHQCSTMSVAMNFIEIHQCSIYCNEYHFKTTMFYINRTEYRFQTSMFYNIMWAFYRFKSDIFLVSIVI